MAQRADWHWEDVKAALWRRNLTLSAIARQHKRGRCSLAMVKTRWWPEAQSIIASALGVPPQAIWPSRYHDDGSPKARSVVGENTTPRRDSNVQKSRAS